MEEGARLLEHSELVRRTVEELEGLNAAKEKELAERSQELLDRAAEVDALRSEMQAADATLLEEVSQREAHAKELGSLRAQLQAASDAKEQLVKDLAEARTNATTEAARTKLLAEKDAELLQVAMAEAEGRARASTEEEERLREQVAFVQQAAEDLKRKEAAKAEELLARDVEVDALRIRIRVADEERAQMRDQLTE